MNAQIQRAVMACKISLSLLGLLWGWATGQGWLGLVAAVAIFCFSGLFILLGLLVLRRVNRGAPHLPTRALLGAWWREWSAFERVFSWQQPFATQRYPDYLPATCRERGVLLVHGFTCNRGLWNGWMKRLGEQSTPFVALTLEPAFGSIDAYAEQIEAGVQALLRLGGPPPVIVAHSMGGLAVRAWLRRYGDGPGGAPRLAHVMTLGSPHQGTLMARFSPARNARQMRIGNAWLAELARSEAPELRALFSCYFSYFDQVVCPVRTAVLTGAREIEVPHSGHMGLLDHPRAFADLQQWLAEKKP
ncbi:alpha/beta fold hydrolase [Roseateles sp.]|uniref:alpha/beta fold hydrolase n=1 Tax=Roseateles sp. TaxID=1971397 RepID=UPI00286A5928|nr:alpha/beta fold hydrolase [Roseateles sp.]